MPTTGHLEDYIDTLSEESSPDTANDMLLIRDDTDGSMKKIAPATLVSAGSGIPTDGWVIAAAMTYASADDPNFTVTISGDVSDTYGVGMRIKLTQATGGTKYFIIVKVAVSGDTTLTLYGGTDYDLVNEAISNPYYSPVKVPFGFSVDPTKWTYSFSDTSVRNLSTPNADTYYNIGSGSIAIPLGAWYIYGKWSVRAAEANNVLLLVTTALSTSNNSASDADLVAEGYVGTQTSPARAEFPFFVHKVIVLASKTTYYPIAKVGIANVDTLSFQNDSSKMLINCVCAYL